MLASAEGASGKNLENSTRVVRKSAVYTTVHGKSAQNTDYFESAPKSLVYECVGFARVSRTKKKDVASAEGASGIKFGEFYATFYAKVPFAPLCLATSPQNTEYCEKAPKTLIYEYVGFARASRTKRKRCSRAPKARAEKNWDISSNFGRKIVFCDPPPMEDSGEGHTVL